MGRLIRADLAACRRRSNPARSVSSTSPRTAPRVSIRSASTSAIAPRFSAQMSGQMSGCPAATLVMSLNPPAASRSTAKCSSDRAAAIPISADAVRWGTCDTRATSASCRSGARVTTSAPREVTTDRMRAKAPSSVSPEGVSTQLASTNIAGSAPSTPSCSEPAIGWPPTNRGSPTASTTGAFTPPTSVTTPPGATASASTTISGI